MKGVTPCSCLFELLSADIPVFSAFVVVGLCFLTAEEVRARDKLMAPDGSLTTHLPIVGKVSMADTVMSACTDEPGSMFWIVPKRRTILTAIVR